MSTEKPAADEDPARVSAAHRRTQPRGRSRTQQEGKAMSTDHAASEKENGMGAKKPITLELIRARLRSLERRGFVVSSLDMDGHVRWHLTEKGRREDPSESDDRTELDS